MECFQNRKAFNWCEFVCHDTAIETDNIMFMLINGVLLLLVSYEAIQGLRSAMEAGECMDQS